jgi:hypothetical protein
LLIECYRRGIVPSTTNDAVEWDGTFLTGWIKINGIPTRVSASREMIHGYAGAYRDVLTWEIDLHRNEIFEKLIPFFAGTVAR